MLRTDSSALALAATLLLAPVFSSAAPAAGDAAVPAAATESIWPQGSSDVAADPAVRFGVLPNGMRYAIKRNTTPPGEASLRLRIDAGSLHETEEQRGLAHFLEHMVLNGTTNVPEGEFVRMLERHGLRFGPDTNASTSFTQTVYKLDLPETDAETVDTALFLLREVVGEAILAADAIASERGIVLSEERTRSTPGYRILVDELGYMLPGQRVAERLPIGLTEVIRTAPRERFVQFYQAYYRPERATLIAVGDFDVDEMESEIRARFAGWRGQGAAGADPELGRVADREVQTRAIAEPGGTERVSLTWVHEADARPDTRATRADKLAERLAMQVLNHRLERIAATTAPPPYVAASLRRSDIADSASVVQMSATIRPGAWEQALQVIEHEQRRLVQHGVTQAELDREIAQLRTALTTAAARAETRTSSSQANGLVSAVDDDEVFAAPAASLGIFEEAEPGLTRERIHEAARTLFEGADPLIYMSASETAPDAETALLAAWRAAHAEPVAPPEARAAVDWPYDDFGNPGEVVERHRIGDGIDATAVRFANGVRLTVKQTDFADDEILVSVFAGDGRGNQNPAGGSLQWAIGPGLVMGGMERISFQDMRETLAARAIGANVVMYDDRMAYMARTRPDDFETQLQLLGAYISEPGWDPVGWNRVRATSEQKHDEFEATPGGVYSRDAAALLHGGDGRWATPTREQMQASSIEQARALLADSFAREPIEVVVVGDIDVDQAIALTAATFGALPARIEEPDRIVAPRFPDPTPEPVRLTHGGRADQGLAMIAWPTMGLYADARQSRELELLMAVYRLRLVDRIREEQGTTYSPAARQVVSEYFDSYGWMFGRIEAPPEKLDGFLADAQDIARDLAANPVGADELERARRPLIESVQRSRNSNRGWLSRLPGIQQDPRVAAAVRSQIGDYESVTPESLRRAAERFMTPDAAWKLMIVPR